MDVDAKLQELRLSLPPAPKPVAAYVPAVRTGQLLFVSGQLPMADGKLLACGPVPSAVSIADAQTAARQATLNGLAIVHDQISGDWSKLARIVHLRAFVQCDDGFDEPHIVANGASELLEQLLGQAGRHARAATGVNALPLNAAVELELIAELTV